MKLSRCWIAILLAVAGFAAGVETPDDSVPPIVPQIPAKARTKSNPFASNPDAAAAGRKLFQRHCAECHGDGAIGGRRGPSLRSEELRHAAPGEIFWIVSNGIVRRGMPAWTKLPEAQRWQIVTFLLEAR